MGGKSTASSQQVTIPPEVLARYNAVNAKAEQAASTPFQTYSGEFVAPLSPSQMAGISNTNLAAGQAQPYYQAGTSALLQSYGAAQPFNYGAAGLAAAVRAAHRALPLLQPGHSLRFAVLPAGEDPDSLLRAGRLADVQAAIEAATPLADILWRATATGDFSTPERRAGLRESLQELLRQIAHPVVREYYKRHFSEALQKAFPAPAQPERRPWTPPGQQGYSKGYGQRVGGRRPVPPPNLTPRAGAAVGSSGPRERVLLAALVNHPALLPLVDELLAQVAIRDGDLDTLRHQLLDIAPTAESLDSASLRAQLSGTARQVADRLVAESTTMVDKFVRPETDLADAETHWRDVLAQHMRAGEFEHRWF
mgnify:CR=1 FL=1